MDVSRAVTGLVADGVYLDDLDAPYAVVANIVQVDGAAKLTELTISPKNGRALQRNWLCELPLREIFLAASAIALGSEHTNESYYRRLAAGGIADQESRILTVAEWAAQVNRPGGRSQAVADFWGVSVQTARRWLRRARASAGASAQPAPVDR